MKKQSADLIFGWFAGECENAMLDKTGFVKSSYAHNDHL